MNPNLKRIDVAPICIVYAWPPEDGYRTPINLDFERGDIKLSVSMTPQQAAKLRGALDQAIAHAHGQLDLVV